MDTTKVLVTVWVVSQLVLTTACGGGGGGTPSLGPGPDGPVFKPADPLPEGLLEQVVAQGVSEKAARLAFDKYEMFRGSIRNGRWLSLIDFTKHSGQPRLYVIEVATGHVDKIHVAHGTGSDSNKDGVPEKFSNVPNSKRSSLGSYLISEKYYGKYGASMRTDGLEPTNSLVRQRSIVMHPSKYVSADKTKQGMSWGCPAVPYPWITKLIDRLRDGSFMYAYSTFNAFSMDEALEIEKIMTDPFFQWVDESEAAPVDGEW